MKDVDIDISLNDLRIQVHVHGELVCYADVDIFERGVSLGQYPGVDLILILAADNGISDIAKFIRDNKGGRAELARFTDRQIEYRHKGLLRSAGIATFDVYTERRYSKLIYHLGGKRRIGDTTIKLDEYFDSLRWENLFEHLPPENFDPKKYVFDKAQEACDNKLNPQRIQEFSANIVHLSDLFVVLHTLATENHNPKILQVAKRFAVISNPSYSSIITAESLSIGYPYKL